MTTSTGTGVADPSFLQSFSQIYSAKTLQNPWYAGMYDYFYAYKFDFILFQRCSTCNIIFFGFRLKIQLNRLCKILQSLGRIECFYLRAIV